MNQRARRAIRTTAKYIFLTAVGIILFKYASAYAMAWRGYKAVGGEYFLLLLPIFYAIVAEMARSMKQTVLEIFEESKAERMRRKGRRAG